MKRFCLVGFLALLCALSAGGWCQTTVVVTPNDVGEPGSGKTWILGLQQGTGTSMPRGEFEGAGPDSGMPPAGNGSFRIETFYSDTDRLSKVYLGTNLFTGRALADITTFKVWTYVRYMEEFYRTHGVFPSQPPQVEITTDSGSEPYQQRTFVYKPWGQHSYENDQLRAWQEWDLLLPYPGPWPPNPVGHWDMLHVADINHEGDWDWVKTRYPGTMTLQEPYVGDYTQGYAPDYRFYNQSGTSLAIKLGSGRAFYENNADHYGKAWWYESCNVWAYVDKLEIAFNNGDHYIFDFEASTAPRGTYAINNRAAYHGIMPTAVKNFYFVAFGRVISVTNADMFVIDDGSSKPIRVSCPSHPAYENAYVRCRGVISITNPRTLTCTADDVKFIY